MTRTARSPVQHSLLLAFLTALLGLVAIAFPGIAHAAAVPPGDRGPCLCSNRYLYDGQYLLSQNGAYQLSMQSDGNLVVYNGLQPLWASQTAGNPGAWAVLQSTDGNLVVYSATGAALWSAYVNSPGDTLQMQNDGNLVVYSPAGSAQWATMTSQPATHGQTLNTNPGGSGQCTWWVEKQFAGYTGQYINTLGIYGTNGNALYWAYNAAHRGWTTGVGPRVDSIAVFSPSYRGVTSSVGHVAWVTQVYPARNAIVVTEMNVAGLGVVDTRTISPAFNVSGLQYIYVNA